VNVAFGALGSANKRVRVSVPMVESYGVPAGVVLSKTKQSGGTITFGDGARPTTIPAVQLEQLLRPAGGFDPKLQAVIDRVKRDQKAKGYLVLITEVYATRSIDISIEAEVGRGGGLNLRPTAALLQKLPGFAATEPTTQPTTGPTAGATTQPAVTAAQFEVSTPAQIAAAMTNQLNEQLAASTPGVNVKFISVTALGVSMRRTYERPIVIGYRGIVYKLDDKSQVVLAGSASGFIPVTAFTVAEGLRAQMEESLATQITAIVGGSPKVGLTFVPNAQQKVIRVKARVVPVPPTDLRDPVRAAVEAEVRGTLTSPTLPVELSQ